MGIIDRSIKLPVTVTVGAILIILFGFISFFRVPVQLTPDVEKPKISVKTVWSGASPELRKNSRDSDGGVAEG